MTPTWDVVVVGGGNAAFCAALSAREGCERVLVLERAPEDEAGGNSRFTAGAMRVAYDGVEDLRKLMPDLSEEELARTDFGTYTEEQFLDDMARVMSTDGEPIPNLYAAGELVGGIFYFNYPGGTGLTNGAVFGKIAGASASSNGATR